MKPHDDAGRVFTLVSLSEMTRDPRMADPRFALMLERTVRAQLMHRESRRLVALALALLLPMALFGSMLLRMPVAFSMPLTMIVVIGLVLAGRRSIRSRATPQIISALVRHGVCAGCGYDLPEHPTGDGIVRCPECACTWKASRIRSRLENKGLEWGSKPAAERGLRELTSGTSVFGPTRAIDARGRSVPLVSTSLRAQLTATPDGPYRLRLLNAKAGLRPVGLGLRVGVGVLIAVLGASNLAVSLYSPRGMHSILLAMVIAASFAFFGMALVRSGLGTPRRVLIRTMLTNQLCPTCAADVSTQMYGRDVVPNEIECPDCGAAWNVRSDTTSHPPVA
jgi:DNA-directed RNA polymerase subunit RPC12/RpoP